MTAFPSDTAPHGLDEAAHFAALPASPLAAYALGMLQVLQRAPLALDCAAPGREAPATGDAIARRVLAFLDDARVPLAEKHALVATIERAADLRDVQSVLQLHALADGLGATTADAPLPPQQLDTPCINTGAPPHSETARTAELLHHNHDHELIPEALACAICCDELMLKPVSLLCGHSFCKHCVDLWLRSCANCPTCRAPVAGAPGAVAVNVALHEIMATFFPDQLKQLEDRDDLERREQLRALITQSIESGRSIRDLRDRDQHEIAAAEVANVLASDPTLQQQVLAAEIRERLRKEKALREESRRRHLIAYCGALPASAHAHVQRIHSTAARPAAPTPSVQSNRPVKKYVPPPPKKTAFFGSLLRHLHHDAGSPRAHHSH